MWDRELVSSDAMLYASVVGSLLITYKSVLVDPAGRLYAPVAAFLADGCTEIVSAEEVEDSSMLFGSAYSVVRRIWAVCPGPDHPHRCHTSVDVDKEVRNLVAGQAVRTALPARTVVS